MNDEERLKQAIQLARTAARLMILVMIFAATIITAQACNARYTTHGRCECLTQVEHE
jgi:hypothetical protein